MSLNTPKKFLIIPRAGIATECVICGAECPPAGRMNVPGKGKVNLKTEIKALQLGIVLPTKETHFICKSKCYGERLKHHNCPREGTCGEGNKAAALEAIKNAFLSAFIVGLNVHLLRNWCISSDLRSANSKHFTGNMLQTP